MFVKLTRKGISTSGTNVVITPEKDILINLDNVSYITSHRDGGSTITCSSGIQEVTENLDEIFNKVNNPS